MSVEKMVETELLERAERAEASNYIRGENLALLTAYTSAITTLVASGDFETLATYFEECGVKLPPRHENPCGFPDTIEVRNRAYEFSARNFSILLHVAAALRITRTPAKHAR